MAFTSGQFDFLLATDLACRGLDIADIEVVINFEFPVELMRYIHRVGRTARAGKEGVSFTICDESESKKLKKLMRKYKEKPILLKIDKLGVIQNIKRIRKLRSSVERVLSEEQWEKMAINAERDLKKAENMLKHKAEIFNRPRKRWIMTNEEKKRIN